MKKILLTMAFCTTVVLGNATDYLTETFDYTVGNPLAGQGSWTSSGSFTDGAGRIIISGNLAYSNSGGTYFLSGEGKTVNSAIISSSNYFVYKKFNEEEIAEGVVYFSFLFQPGVNQTQSNADVIRLTNWNTANATTNSTGPAFWVGKSATDPENAFRFGTTRYSSSGSDIVWGADFSNDKINDVFLIVIKYDITNSKTSLYVNPVIASASEPESAYAQATVDGSTIRKVNYVLFRSNGKIATRFNIGGLCVASTWTDVVKVKGGTSDKKILADKGEPVSVETFTMMGARVNSDKVTNGAYIQKSTYADGSVEAVKMMK